MSRTPLLTLVATAALGTLAAPALAASFDCAKASTPFEKAICTNAELSAADDHLSKTYATARSGLSEAAATQLRDSQRQWLSYVNRACTPNGKPLTKGSFDEAGLYCLIELFNSRSKMLEQSRMQGGWRFFPVSQYAASPDPTAEYMPNWRWPVDRRELNFVQIDSPNGIARTLNTLLEQHARQMPPILGESRTAGDDGSAKEDSCSQSCDTINSITIQDVAGDDRISLRVLAYWNGHGANHGNWLTSNLHYLVKEQRWLDSLDLFSGGSGWEHKLYDLTLAKLQARFAETENMNSNYRVSVAEAILDPTRWDLSNPYALGIQFQLYEVTSYADGEPLVRISWEELAPYLNSSADRLLAGPGY